MIRLGPAGSPPYYPLFLKKKISPELTSAANPPLFAEEDWPWASICAHLPLLYMWTAYHSMACQAVHRSTPRIQSSETRATEVERENLTAAPPASPFIQFYTNKHENLDKIKSFLECINFEKKLPFESRKVLLVIYSNSKKITRCIAKYLCE